MLKKSECMINKTAWAQSYKIFCGGLLNSKIEVPNWLVGRVSNIFNKKEAIN